MNKNNNLFLKITKIISVQLQKNILKFLSQHLKTKVNVHLKEVGINKIHQNLDRFITYTKLDDNFVAIAWDIDLIKVLIKNITNEETEYISQINKIVFLNKFAVPIFESFIDLFGKYINLSDCLLKTSDSIKDIFEEDIEVCYIKYALCLDNLEFYFDFLIPQQIARDNLSRVDLSNILSKKIICEKYDFTNITTKASIILGKKYLSLLDYSKIKNNDLIILDKEDPSLVWIFFENKKCIKGRIGIHNNKLAIKVTEVE
ncbi:MAG: FliM/FliN family flagellar motor C-terminal domain-containing protein [Elusimicrobiales bacterium]|nr:FliM/FliN family flagellar motor C-terminal domain-containing protein [Elusimicrobiales bacterium]